MDRLHLTVAALAAGLLLTGCAGGGSPRIQVDFPSKVQEQRCDSNAVCKIKVYARIAPNGSCEVMPQFENVRIGVDPQTHRGYTPKMHWKIDSIDSGHAYDYRFAFEPTATPPVYGTAIGNNTAGDFDDPGHDKTWWGQKDITTFKWENRHLSSRPTDPFPYDLNVERSPHNEQSWTPCARVDPRMFND